MLVKLRNYGIRTGRDAVAKTFVIPEICRVDKWGDHRLENSEPRRYGARQPAGTVPS